MSAAVNSSSRGGEDDTVQNNQEGVSLSYHLSAQDCNWRLPWLAEYELCTMTIEIECEPRPIRPAALHSPQHFQAAQLVELITGINKRCPN